MRRVDIQLRQGTTKADLTFILSSFIELFRLSSNSIPLQFQFLCYHRDMVCCQGSHNRLWFKQSDWVLASCFLSHPPLLIICSIVPAQPLAYGCFCFSGESVPWSDSLWDHTGISGGRTARMAPWQGRDLQMEGKPGLLKAVFFTSERSGQPQPH